MDFAERIRAALAENIGQERAELWFENVRFSLDEGLVRLGAPSRFLMERLKRDFGQYVRTAMSSLGHDDLSLEFVVDTSGTCEERPADDAESVARPQAPRRLLAPSRSARKRRFRKFDSFVEGDCNRLALKSAEMVVSQPGEISPLVVHGPTGVGKTHLMEAIWSKVRSQQRRARIVYLSAEQFTTYFIEALKGNGLANFRQKYRHADTLIIDDIQFFAGKQATLVELAYTIDELSRENRQLVLTTDRPPNQLAGCLGREISNRLAGGLVCAMKPICQQTMESISMQWAADRQIRLDADFHAAIAGRMRGDARQLSGVLNRLRATSLAMNEPITMRMANEVMYELVPTQARIVRLQDVRKAVCEVFGVEPDSLRQKSRSRAIAQPRMVAMYISRQLTAAGLHEISQFFGRSSHSSAVSASNKVNSWLSKGEMVRVNGQMCDIREIVSQIEAKLKAG